MKFTKEQQKTQDMMNSLISKCWEDESFKAKLISDPVATIEAFKGSSLNLPEGKNLIINDQTDGNIHINIPSKPNFDNMELTDEQLEAVAGGVLTPWEVLILIIKGAGAIT